MADDTQVNDTINTTSYAQLRRLPQDQGAGHDQEPGFNQLDQRQLSLSIHMHGLSQP
jgi:hypothetical protein